MRLRSFHAQTMSDAMQQVRDELGENAIIVATREDEEHGVRVTAAIEEDDRFETSDQSQSAPNFAISDKEEENDQHDVLTDLLMYHGLPAMLIDRLNEAAESIRADDTHDLHYTLCSILDRGFRFQPLNLKTGAPIIMLVGPPGSGKSLTAAKIATRISLAGTRPHVISLDTLRAGGREQLVSLMRVLNIKVISADDPPALEDILQSLRQQDDALAQKEKDYKKPPIIIDCPATNIFDDAEQKALHSFIQAAHCKPYLVLAAGGDAEEQIEIARRYGQFGLSGLITTRLDTARRYGGLLAAAAATDLPFTEMGDTARVPDGLKPLSARLLASVLIGGDDEQYSSTPYASEQKHVRSV